jgi:microcompartment protein CcmK/EutM
MRIGQVIGRVTLNRSEASYKAGRFLLVHPLSRAQLSGGDLQVLARASTVVVYDKLGARAGDLIGYSESGEAAAAFQTPTPVDAYCAAILDTITYRPLQPAEPSS